MITSLKIENFKSFGPEMDPLRLQPLNFIVGANASGKTNFFSALRFLKMALLQNVEVAATEFGGIGEIRNKILREREKPKPVRIAVTIDPSAAVRFRIRNQSNEIWTSKEIRYSVEIDVRSSDGVPSVQSEELEVDLFLGKNKKDTFSLRRTREVINFHDPVGFRREDQEMPISHEDRARLVAGSGFFSGVVSHFRRQIEGWSFYNISPDVARLASKDTVDPELGSSGESLASILHRFEKNGGEHETLDQIMSSLRGAVPGFKTVKTRDPDFEGKRSFQVIEERIRSGINPRSVSDGTVRLLALLVIAHSSAKKTTLLAIEEPENGLHPHLSENVVEILRTASTNRQVITTTHNPDFLDFLEPEELILCDKIDGLTNVKHASDVKNIKAFREHFRIGELWEQGRLGGVP
jgi:predicted ATPase